MIRGKNELIREIDLINSWQMEKNERKKAPFRNLQHFYRIIEITKIAD